MTNNEERIWDVLIEDALRESGAPAPMHEMGDRTRRLLQPVGPMGVDRGRSMRYTRHRWVRITAGTLAVVLVLTILYLGVALLPMLSEANREQPQSAEGNQSPVRQDAGESTPPAPVQQPKEPEQPVETPEPEPKPEDTPKQPEPKPEDTVEQPKPEPKPEDTVEQPKPEPKPEDTVEQPEPKPEDTVEQPKPDTGTAPTWPEGDDFPVRPPHRDATVFLLSADKGADLQFAQYGWTQEQDGKDMVGMYRDVGDMREFDWGTWFKCRKPVEFEFRGILIRFQGEIYIGRHVTLWVELVKDSVFIDNRGREAMEIELGASGIAGECWLSEGMALFERDAKGMNAMTFEGELQFEFAEATTNQIVPAGKQCEWTKRGVEKLRDLHQKLGDDLLTKALPQRVVYRENFDADPQGRLREGKLLNGAIVGETVFWGYPENIAHEPGLVVRLRVRLKNVTALTVTQFCPERNDNYSIALPEYQPNQFLRTDLKNDEWCIISLPVDALLERTKHEGHPQAGESFQNISIQLQGKNAQVELDWVELIRAVK